MPGHAAKHKPLTLKQFSARAGGFDESTHRIDGTVRVHFIDARGHHHHGYVTDVKINPAMGVYMEIRAEAIDER
jgi:hypothetical protein